MKRYYQEYGSIKPSFTSIFSRPLEDYGSSNKIKLKPLVKRNDNRAKKRLTDALNYLLITSPLQYTYCKIMKQSHRFKLNFITLTLSDTQKHDDKFIKEKMLEPYLKWLLYQGATGYVWKAEVQKNGNLHFHITSNKYIHWREVRSFWNRLQQKHGYLDNYLIANGHCDANSTDIHAVINEKEAIKYMFKYLLKEEPDKRKIDGHNYGYSRNLANIKITYPTDSKEFTECWAYINSMQIVKKEFDYVTVYYHDLINLDKCPECLRKTILEQTLQPNKPRRRSTMSDGQTKRTK